MQRDQLEHIIRAAWAITGAREIVVLGSQAVLGQHPDAPEELRVSIEADVLTKAKRSDVMSRIRGRGNKETELALRAHGKQGTGPAGDARFARKRLARAANLGARIDAEESGPVLGTNPNASCRLTFCLEPASPACPNPGGTSFLGCPSWKLAGRPIVRRQSVDGMVRLSSSWLVTLLCRPTLTVLKALTLITVGFDRPMASKRRDRASGFRRVSCRLRVVPQAEERGMDERCESLARCRRVPPVPEQFQPRQGAETTTGRAKNTSSPSTSIARFRSGGFTWAFRVSSNSPG